jgi:hypothetical protein
MFDTPATIFSPANVAQVSLTQPSVIHRYIGLRQSNAGGLNRQIVTPDSPHVLASFVKFMGEDQRLLCIVDAKCGHGIAIHPPFCGLQADISPVKMKMRQGLIETQARRLPQHEDDLIERLHRHWLLQGCPNHTATGRVDVPPTPPVSRLAIAPQDPPLCVLRSKVQDGGPQLSDPLPWQENILMTKYN